MDRNTEDLLTFYALDALTDEERKLVEAYLARHPEARERVEELRQAASALPYGAPPVKPSDRPKQRLMERIETERRASAPIPSQVKRAQPGWLASIFQGFNRFAFGALSLAVAVLAIGWVIVIQREVSNLRQQVTTLEQGLLAQARSLEELNIKQSQVNASTVKTISLRGTEAQPQAYGQLIADPDSPSAVLVVAGLAPPQAGKVHQVWLIQGNTPISAGFLTVDVDGQGVMLLESDQPIGSFDALGVSIEPEGGSMEPKGDIVILGNL